MVSFTKGNFTVKGYAYDFGEHEPIGLRNKNVYNHPKMVDSHAMAMDFQ